MGAIVDEALERLPPMASISSMKMTAGERRRASSKKHFK